MEISYVYVLKGNVSIGLFTCIITKIVTSKLLFLQSCSLLYCVCYLASEVKGPSVVS